MVGPGYGPLSLPIAARAIVSFGYRHIVPEDVVVAFNRRLFNVHISLLPHNRGASPNLWAWYDGTPHGVTIHLIDDGIDTGPIVVQQRIQLDICGSLRTTYNSLMVEARALLRESLPYLLAGDFETTPQLPGGSYHTRSQSDQLLARLSRGYDTPVSEVRAIGAAQRNVERPDDSYCRLAALRTG